MPVIFVYDALMRHPTVKAHGTPARVHDHALRFVAKGLPLLEPRFLGMVPAPGEVAHGVVIEMNERGWAALSRHQVGHAFETVTAWVDDVAIEARARVLREADQVPEAWPSARYARTLVEGAAHHGLPAEVYATYSEAEAQGSRASIWLGPIWGPVRWLVPWLGPPLATLVVLGGILALGALVVAGMVRWLG